MTNMYYFCIMWLRCLVFNISFQMDMYLTELVVLVFTIACGIASLATQFSQNNENLNITNILTSLRYFFVCFILWYFISYKVYSTYAYRFVRAEVIK